LHAGQTVVPRAPALSKNGRVDAFSVVSDLQLKMPVAILDRDVDPSCLRVTKSIADCFRGDTVDFVTNDRREFPGDAFDLHMKLWTGTGWIEGYDQRRALARWRPIFGFPLRRKRTIFLGTMVSAAL
jgi:hypothetical protein